MIERYFKGDRQRSNKVSFKHLYSRHDVTASNSDVTMAKLVQSKSHFYHVTYTYISCVDLAKHTRAIKTQTIIYSSRPLLPLSSPFSFCIPRPQFQSRRFVSCSRIATSPSSFSGSHPPAGVTTRATCCSPMPLSVVLHVRDCVSELFLSPSPSSFLSLSLSPSPSSSLSFSLHLLSSSRLSQVTSLSGFRSFLVVCSRLFPTC